MLPRRGKVGNALKGTGALSARFHSSNELGPQDRLGPVSPYHPPVGTELSALVRATLSDSGAQGNHFKVSQDINNCFTEYEEILPQQESIGHTEENSADQLVQPPGTWTTIGWQVMAHGPGRPHSEEPRAPALCPEAGPGLPVHASFPMRFPLPESPSSLPLTPEHPSLCGDPEG